MTRAQLRDKVRIFIGESSANSAVEDGDINNDLDREMPIIAVQAKLMTFSKYNLVDGTQSYGLPNDFLLVRAVYFHADSNRREKLENLSLDQFESVSRGASAQESEPKYYKIELGRVSNTDDTQPPGDISLWPIPHQNYTDGMYVYYYQRPDNLTLDTQSPELFVHMHNALSYKVASNMAFKIKDRGLARDLYANYRDEMAIHRRLAARDAEDGPFSTLDVMGYTRTQW